MSLLYSTLELIIKSGYNPYKMQGRKFISVHVVVFLINFLFHNAL